MSEIAWLQTPGAEDRTVFEQVGRAPDATVNYGELPEQVIDIYLGSERELPLLVLIHGGYWRNEYDRLHMRPFAAALADAGWQVALIEYQRSPGRPYLMTADVRNAIKFAIDEIPDHSGSPVLIGHSAGGQLAMWAASVTPNLKSVIALAPVSDLGAGEALHLDEGAIESFLGAPASERSDLDPMHITTLGNQISIIHGDKDMRVPIDLSISYVAAKKSQNEKIHFIALPGIGHFELIDPRHAVWEIIQSELNKFRN